MPAQEWKIDHGSLRISAWHDLVEQTTELQVNVHDRDGRHLLQWQVTVEPQQQLVINVDYLLMTLDPEREVKLCQ